MTAGSIRQQPIADLRGREFEDDFGEPGVLDSLLERMRPDEGWLSVILVPILAGTMAWSIADARWILGRDDLTSFLIWIALAASLWGYVSSRLGVPAWIAHVMGCVLGAFVIIEAVGSIMPDAQPSFYGWFQAAANSVGQAYLDLTWRHQISTLQYGHFCLILGVLVWGTAQAASYDVFGYHRSINGILLMAVILIANMTIDAANPGGQFLALVVYTSAALWLLVKAHASDVRSSWQRHRIWRGADLKATNAQGGVGFAALPVCGALILTTVASSAPLQSLWPGVNDNLRGFETWLSAYLPNGGQTRLGPGADFGNSTKIISAFQASPSLVMTINELSQTASNGHWRVIAYDDFKNVAWAVSGGSESDLGTNALLNDGTYDQVDPVTSGRAVYAYTVHVRDTSLKHLVIANEPRTVNVPVTRQLVGGTTAQSDVISFSTSAGTYTVTSLLPNIDPSGAGLTEWRLRQAGTDYPPGLLERYTQGAQSIGNDGRYLLRLIEGAASKGAVDPTTGHFLNAYDAAQTMQNYLRDPQNFTYDTNISDLDSSCQSLTTVDCFAVYKRGFCEQYATTMTMLMRMEGFPTRYVEGYLSGHVDQASRAIQITGQQRHAWVEVYFPGYGWIPFDPTGGSVGQPTQLPVGSQAPGGRTPVPSASRPAVQSGGAPTPRPSGGPAAGQTSNGGPWDMLPGALIVVVAFIGLMVLWRRRPRRLEAPDTVYRGIVRVASRLGYKPLPTQTVYEYTGMLAELVPRVRQPLSEVATAQVEVVYGRRRLPTERLISLAAAQRVVQQALLRLVFRLPGHRPKRPRTAGHGRPPEGGGRE